MIPRVAPRVAPLAARAAGGAAGGAAGAGVETGTGADCTVGGALGTAAGAAATGGVAATVTGAFTTGGGAVSTVATGADTSGVAAAALETVALVAGDPVTVTFDGAGVVATPAGVATALGVLGANAAAGASTTATAGIAGTVAASPDPPAAVRAPAAPAPARDALRGRRSALSAAMRSAAGFVFAKPAVYTISTAAEPRATRLLPRGLGTEKAGASKGETAGRAGSMNVMLYVANRVSAAPFVRVRPGETMRLTVLR